MNTIVVVMLFLLSPNVWSMCVEQFQSKCQNLEIVSASKDVEKVYEGGGNYKNVDSCKVAIKSDQSIKLIYAKLETCPNQRFFVGSIDFACNDMIGVLEFDKLVVRSAKECPDIKKWWEFWK